jgi:nitroimidazol reductase NimA-like FMN-containing flavoprotein (pyridoxamine 5'-phosphate oxidase superfamily)
MSTPAHEDLHTLEALDAVECRYLLRWEVVGRIAFVDGHDAPAVLPVNYVIAEDAVFLRTEPELAERLRDRPISFQVDRLDPFRRVGWSVLVRGRAEVVDRADVAIATWAPGERRVLVRVAASETTGRRLEVTLPAVDERGYL